MKYWIKLNGTDLGLFAPAEIARLYADKIKRETPCAAVGSDQWATIGELIPEILSGADAPPEPVAAPAVQARFCDFPRTTLWTTLFYALAVLQCLVGAIIGMSVGSWLPFVYGLAGATASCFAAFVLSLLVDLRWIQSEALNELKRSRTGGDETPERAKF